MGDFLLDFRPAPLRCREPDVLSFLASQRVERFDDAHYSLSIVQIGASDLWAACDFREVRVAVAGTLALDEREWLEAERWPCEGGLGARAILRRYLAGKEVFAPPDGAFVVHVHDRRAGVYHLVTDPCGLMPCYRCDTPEGTVLASHPDVLARAVGGRELDVVSLGEFLSTGRVNSPHTYYAGINALEAAGVHTLTLPWNASEPVGLRRYYNWEGDDQFEPDQVVAERLSAAIRRSTARRSGPRLGRTAVALSGGLDSRTVLSCADPDARPVAFCTYDAENVELRTARAIARAAGIEFHALRRAPDQYGETAELGVRISGGMGDLASNHFLGFRDRFASLGFDNLITGCYFDYLFKALALDVSESRFARRQRLVGFRFEHYLPIFSLASSVGAEVMQRLDVAYPALLRSPQRRASLAVRRTFPLYQEGDNAMRLTMLRTSVWQAPAADRDVIDVCKSMSIEQRLDASVFRRAVLLACPTAVGRVINTNTLAAIDASRFTVALKRYGIGLRRAIERRFRRSGSAESWPNWEQYLRRSDAIRALWQSRRGNAEVVLEAVTGAALPRQLDARTFRQAQWYLRLLTLKIWLDQRG